MTEAERQATRGSKSPAVNAVPPCHGTSRVTCEEAATRVRDPCEVTEWKVLSSVNNRVILLYLLYLSAISLITSFVLADI